MKQQKSSCCAAANNKKGEGFLSGIIFGILPHSFCIAFVVLSIVGAVTASAFLKRFLLMPNFFLSLTVISLILATASSVIYLKKNGGFSVLSIKNKWRYLLVVYSSTVLINLMMFFVVFPAVANVNFQPVPNENPDSLSELTIHVEIPCSGHAPLIIDEIKKNLDVQSVGFSMPNTFNIKYDPKKTTPEKLVALEIFKTYKATIN